MGFIYKITNTVNDKVYVGQTIHPLRYRFKRHFYDAQKSDTKIYRAMKKHGFENFSISLIEEVDDDLLDEREIYWIEKFDSYKHGYNSTIGGMGSKKFYNKQIRLLWDEGYSSGEIQNIIGCGKGVVHDALIDYENYSVKESIVRGQKDSCVQIAQYALDGDLICVYNKMADASATFGCAENSAPIIKVCKEECGTAFGYQWRYVGEEVKDKISPTIINAGKSHIIEIDGKLCGLRDICLELFGEFGEKAYNSIKKYHNYSECSIQESFERYIKTNGATRSGDIIIYNNIKYLDITSASNAAGISKNRVYQAKSKFGYTPQEAFDYCLNTSAGNNGPIEVCVNGIIYRTVADAIKGSGVSRTKFYKYKKETGCSPEEAIKYLLSVKDINNEKDGDY